MGKLSLTLIIVSAGLIYYSTRQRETVRKKKDTDTQIKPLHKIQYHNRTYERTWRAYMFEYNYDYDAYRYEFYLNNGNN